MRMLDILMTMNPKLDPDKAKLHIATHSPNLGREAIDIYFSGEFNEWQSWNEPESFNRDLVISLICLPPRSDNKWLFAGIHRCEGGETRYSAEMDYTGYRHNLTEEKEYEEMNGRLVVTFERPSRMPYLVAGNWFDDIHVSEIYPKRHSIGEFPGFKAVNLSRENLELIYQESLESWRVALSNVAGIYLIADTSTGKLYVGSAYGEGGIWGRWSEYVKSGHGNNVELENLLEEGGIDYTRNFRYAILEISDVLTSNDEIFDRESHWKQLLMSRSYGLNAN